MKPGILQTNQHVVTADGTECRVTAVWREYQEVPETAELMTAEGETLTLPTLELKRTARKTPPVEGIPEPRLRCVFCDKPLPYWTKTDRTGRMGNQKIVKRTFQSWKGYIIEGEARTCSLNCAWAFASAAYRAGYRITRKPKG